MIVLKLAFAATLLILGGGNRFLHRRHRQRIAATHSSAWSYYARLRRQGNWQGTFMLWSTGACIAVALALAAMTAWHLSLSWSPLVH
jgi:hypothetical protein